MVTSSEAVFEAGSLRSFVRGDIEALPEVLRRHRVLLAVLFGSTALGRRRVDSDLDLGVVFSAPPAHGSWMRDEIVLELALEDLLQPSCELNVIALNRVEAPLRKEVADHGALIYADEFRRWTWFRIRAYRDFEDTAKYRRRREEAFLQRYGAHG